MSNQNKTIEDQALEQLAVEKRVAELKAEQEAKQEPNPAVVFLAVLVLVIGVSGYLAMQDDGKPPTIDSVWEFRDAVQSPVCGGEDACYKAALSRLQVCLDSTGYADFDQCARKVITAAKQVMATKS